MNQGAWIAGVDEAGRGPLAGRVVAAAVILPSDYDLPYLNDSKKLSEKRRAVLADRIRAQAVAWAVAAASVEEIDQLNILHATLLAMRRAVEALTVVPSIVEVDGRHVPKGLTMPARAIVQGDSLVAAISAASILAKTSRDAELCALDVQYPEYGFAKHKGYPTAAHLAAIERFGVIQGVHRTSFAPIRRYIADGMIDHCESDTTQPE